MVTGESAKRAESPRMYTADNLSRNDAYSFLRNWTILIESGPSGTNVNDLMLLFVFGSGYLGMANSKKKAASQKERRLFFVFKVSGIHESFLRHGVLDYERRPGAGGEVINAEELQEIGSSVVVVILLETQAELGCACQVDEGEGAV